MKKLLSLVLAVAMILSLLSFASAEEKIVIKVFHYMAQDAKQAGLAAIEAAYTELHPEVEFQNIYYNQGTDYFPQLATALTEEDKPHIMMGNPGLYPDLVEEGYVMDLTENETIKAMGLPAGDLGDVSADGKIYGFPIDFKTWGIFYNTQIFAENNLTVPTTLTELNALQQQLKDLGIDPYVHSFNDAVYGDIEWRNTFWTKALENGDKDIFARLMSGDAKWVDLPYAEQAVENIAARVAFARPDAMSNTQDMALEIFCSGGAAMRYDGSWNIGSMLNKNPQFELGFFVVPIDDEGSAKLNVQVDQSFMVNPQAANADVALDFMEFWLSQGVAWSEISQMPLNTGVVSDKLLPMVRTLAETKASGNIAHYGDFTRPFTSAFTTALRQELTSYVEACVTGAGMTAKECLENLDAAFAEVRELN